jgi:transcriptional regulator with XRE-family HTH domain
MEHDPASLNTAQLIGERVSVIRKTRSMSQEDLADAMQRIGIPFPRVVIAKFESGRRPFLKVDELLGLCIVLGIAPVDLLVPADLADGLYQLTPRVTAAADNVREWVRGESLLYSGLHVAETPFVTPVGGRDIGMFVHWMPEERRKQVMRRWLEMEERDQWVTEHEDELREQWMAEREQEEDQS